MDIRAEFEKWYTKAFGYPFNLTIRDGKYMNSDANSMWIAWQAATEAARGGKAVAWMWKDHNGTHVTDDNYQWNFAQDREGFVEGWPLHAQPPAPVVPDGHYVVPFNPTEKQWSGLARDLIMWLDCASRPTGKSMYEHLGNVGVDVPEWLRDEVPDIDHVPAKGTRAAIIYKAIIMDYEP